MTWPYIARLKAWSHRGCDLCHGKQNHAGSPVTGKSGKRFGPVAALLIFLRLSFRWAGCGEGAVRCATHEGVPHHDPPMGFTASPARLSFNLPHQPAPEVSAWVTLVRL